HAVQDVPEHTGLLASTGPPAGVPPLQAIGRYRIIDRRTSPTLIALGPVRPRAPGGSPRRHRGRRGPGPGGGRGVGAGPPRPPPPPGIAEEGDPGPAPPSRAEPPAPLQTHRMQPAGT